MPRHLKKILQCFRSWIGLCVLLVIILALPASFLTRDGFGLSLEKTPAFGWTLDRFRGGIFGGFQSLNAAIVEGHFTLTYIDYIPHTPAPAPPGGWVLSMLDSDTSHWFAIGSTDKFFGYAGAGRLSSGHPAASTWNQATGFIFPLWPISLTAGFFLGRIFYRKLISRKMPTSLCPTCSYDLRAHHPGNKCPECGTPIPISSTPPSSLQ